MDLPVTFDDTAVNYGTVDFGGTASSFMVDPTAVQSHSFNVTASSMMDYTISGTDRNGAFLETTQLYPSRPEIQ